MRRSHHPEESATTRARFGPPLPSAQPATASPGSPHPKAAKQRVTDCPLGHTIQATYLVLIFMDFSPNPINCLGMPSSFLFQRTILITVKDCDDLRFCPICNLTSLLAPFPACWRRTADSRVGDSRSLLQHSQQHEPATCLGFLVQSAKVSPPQLVGSFRGEEP